MDKMELRLQLFKLNDQTLKDLVRDLIQEKIEIKGIVECILESVDASIQEVVPNTIIEALNGITLKGVLLRYKPATGGRDLVLIPFARNKIIKAYYKASTRKVIISAYDYDRYFIDRLKMRDTVYKDNK